MAKIRKPVRPTVPRNVGYYTPPANATLSSMAAQIGRDRAMSEFYEAITQEQWDYDDDMRDQFLTQRTDNRRHRQQIDQQDHREWLKTGDAGLGNQSKASSTLKAIEEGKTGTEEMAERLRSSGSGGVGAFNSIVNVITNGNETEAWKTTPYKEIKSAETEAKASKKAENDDAEVDWWHAVKEGVGGAFDSIDPVMDPIVKGVTAVAKTDAVGTVFDYLSRPSATVATAADEFYKLNDDDVEKDKGNGKPSLSGGNLTELVSNMFGANYRDSLDDLDGEGLKKIAGGAKRGIQGEGIHFSDVIRNNAERNPNQTIHDSKGYQVAAGLAGDIAFDPLNFVGVGVVRNVANVPLRGARAAQSAADARRLRSVVDEVSEHGVTKPGPLREGESELYSPDELYEILGGNRKVTSKADKARAMREVQAGLNLVTTNMRGSSAHLSKLTKMRNEHKARLDVAVKNHKNSVEAETTLRGLQHREDIGEVPVGTTDAVVERIEFKTVMNGFAKYNVENKGVKGQKSTKAFDDALGEGWKKHPLLSDKERLTLSDPKNVTAALAKTEHANVMKEWGSAKNQLDSAKASLARAKTTEAKRSAATAVRNAEKHMKKANYNANAAKAQVFIRSVNATVAKKLGQPTWRKDGQYGDFTEEVSHLQNLKKRAAEIIYQADALPYKGGKRDIQHDVMPEKSQSSTGAADESSMGAEDLFTIRDGDFDQVDRAQKVYTDVTQELARYDDSLAPANWKSVEVPDVFKAPDGTIDRDLIARLVDHSETIEADGFHHFAFDKVRTADPKVNETLEVMFRNLNREYTITRDRLIKNFKRPTNETAAKKGNQAKGDLTVVKGEGLWGEKYPEGISHDEFIDLVTTTDRTEFEEFMKGAPFNFALPPQVAKEIKGKVPIFINGKTPLTKPLGGKQGLRELSKDSKAWEDFTKSLGMPGAKYADVERTWLDHAHNLFQISNNHVRQHLNKVFQNTLTARRKNAATDVRIQAQVEPSGDELTEIYAKAKSQVIDKAVKQMEETDEVSAMDDVINVPKGSPVDVTREVLKEQKDDLLDGINLALAKAKRLNDTLEVRKLNLQIKKTNLDYDRHMQALSKIKAEADESGKILTTRLKEDAIIRVAQASIENKGSALSVNMFRKQFQIPGTKFLFQGADKAASIAPIRQFADAYKTAFMAPSSQLPEELSRTMHRATANTSQVISLHLKELNEVLGTVPLPKRHMLLNEFIRPGSQSPDTGEVSRLFKELLPFYDGSIIEPHRVIAFLPDHLRPANSQVTSPVELARVLRNAAADSGNKKVDPLELIHAARIAGEGALAQKAAFQAINDTFGVKRLANIDFKTGKLKLDREGLADLKPGVTKENARLVEELGTLGWFTETKLGSGYWFPPELKDDLGRFVQMLEPENAGKAAKFIDEVTGLWKSAVTIYNPPAHQVRNGIGEAMSAWMLGANSPVPFQRAANVVRFMSKEGDKLEAFRMQNPALAHLVEGNSKRGMKVAARLKNGRTISAERAAILYRDQGLSTGFVNNEYSHHYTKTKEAIRGLPGMRGASKANQKWRGMNESYEDFFRMGTFLDSLGKAPKGLTDIKAAEWAADRVRRGHFDYTDFTKFEKTKMLRVFPFYKWTRKAAPFMLTQLFLTPGKMMVYPKVMSAAQEYFSSDDMLQNKSSFMPQFHSFAPQFVQDIMAYQVGGPEGDGTDEYLKVATPQMDALGAVGNVGNAATQLLHPALRLGLDQLEGEAIGPYETPVVTKDERMANLAGVLPQTKLLHNMATDKMSFDKLMRLTGLGYYESKNVTEDEE